VRCSATTAAAMAVAAAAATAVAAAAAATAVAVASAATISVKACAATGRSVTVRRIHERFQHVLVNVSPTKHVCVAESVPKAEVADLFKVAA